MPLVREVNDLGCLYIDELVPGRSDSSGPSLLLESGDRLQSLECPDGRALWGCLQTALQACRSSHGVCAVAARGTGCAAALALAAQLPVDRLVLFKPRLTFPERSGRTCRAARRMAAYARRNLALCASDTLLLGDSTPRLAGWSAYCHVHRIELPGEDGEKMYTIREIASKKAVSRFLHTGELPKTLDFPGGMCIIDG